MIASSASNFTVRRNPKQNLLLLRAAGSGQRTADSGGFNLICKDNEHHVSSLDLVVTTGPCNDEEAAG